MFNKITSVIKNFIGADTFVIKFISTRTFKYARTSQVLDET